MSGEHDHDDAKENEWEERGERREERGGTAFWKVRQMVWFFASMPSENESYACIAAMHQKVSE